MMLTTTTDIIAAHEKAHEEFKNAEVFLEPFTIDREYGFSRKIIMSLDYGGDKISDIKNIQLSLEKVAADPSKLLAALEEFEWLHKYCHGDPPRQGDLRYPFPMPPMCEYRGFNAQFNHAKNVISMFCAIHEYDYIPTVDVLFLFEGPEDKAMIEYCKRLFAEAMIRMFISKGAGMMDTKRYVQETYDAVHVSELPWLMWWKEMRRNKWIPKEDVKDE